MIYTCSVYPHKNLEKLIGAVKLVGIDLVIASVRNVFVERLSRYVKSNDMEKSVHFLGFVSDHELTGLYKSAKAFVFPSLAEGFGLPGLEAMAAGCPVVCSDIPVFHEIYGDAAIYFDPNNARDIAEKINNVFHSNDTYHHSMVERGKEHAKKFSWRKMAQETLEVYKEIIS